MSWHLAVHGHIELKSPQLAAWRRVRLEPASMKDLAASNPGWFTASFRPTSVGDLLDQMRRFGETSGHEFLDVSPRGGGIDLRGLLSEGSLPDWLELLVAALRAAAPFGATGQVQFLGVAYPIGGRLTLAHNDASWEMASEASLGGPEVAEIRAEIAALSEARL